MVCLLLCWVFFPVYFISSTSLWASLKKGVKRKKPNPSIEQEVDQSGTFSFPFCCVSVKPAPFSLLMPADTSNHTFYCWVTPFHPSFNFFFTLIVLICVYVPLYLLLFYICHLIIKSKSHFNSVWIVEMLKWNFPISQCSWSVCHLVNLTYKKTKQLKDGKITFVSSSLSPLSLLPLLICALRPAN